MVHRYSWCCRSVVLRLTAYCGSSGALCLTRTRVLKAEPEEDIGNNGEEVTNQEDGEDTEDINDGQGIAVRGRAIWDKAEISGYW